MSEALSVLGFFAVIFFSFWLYAQRPKGRRWKGSDQGYDGD